MIFSAPSLLAAKPETEAQIKMREALRLKIEELNTQETPPAPAPAPVVEAPVPVTFTKPEAKPVTPKVERVQKSEPAKPKTVVVPVPVEVPVAAPAKVEFAEPVTGSETAAAARLREALEKKMTELNTKPAVTVEPPAPAAKSVQPSPVAKPQPKVVVAPVAPAVVINPVSAKIEPPASPLPVTKQDRLAELLRRYKADELSAQDYHSQRATILAQP